MGSFEYNLVILMRSFEPLSVNQSEYLSTHKVLICGELRVQLKVFISAKLWVHKKVLISGELWVHLKLLISW